MMEGRVEMVANGVEGRDRWLGIGIGLSLLCGKYAMTGELAKALEVLQRGVGWEGELEAIHDEVPHVFQLLFDEFVFGCEHLHSGDEYGVIGGEGFYLIFEFDDVCLLALSELLGRLSVFQ